MQISHAVGKNVVQKSRMKVGFRMQIHHAKMLIYLVCYIWIQSSLISSKLICKDSKIEQQTLEKNDNSERKILVTKILTTK